MKNNVLEEKSEKIQNGTFELGEDYKERFKDEYQNLFIRLIKLGTFIYKYQSGFLDFEPKIPLEVLRRQLSSMEEYASILRERAMIEEIMLW